MNLSKIVYDTDTIFLMNTFEKITHSRLKDCILEEERAIFIVQPGQLRKALGKSAENVKRVSNAIKRKIKVVEFNPELLKFIKNFIHPLKIEAIHEQDNVVILESHDTHIKGLLIGRAAQNLRKLEEYVRRYFPDVKEIKIV